MTYTHQIIGFDHDCVTEAREARPDVTDGSLDVTGGPTDVRNIHEKRQTE